MPRDNTISPCTGRHVAEPAGRRAAANSLASRLVDAGVLSEITGYARDRRFHYAPYIALFN